jgi:hypothetical protein
MDFSKYAIDILADFKPKEEPMRPEAAAAMRREEEMRFAQHGQQGMMTGSTVFARVGAFQRALLLTVAFEYGGIQIQGVALRA